MPTVAIVGGILVVLYFDDHAPPHFHARGADFHARIRIEDGSVVEVEGRISARHRRRLLEWTDGSSSKIDFGPEIARGCAWASLAEPAVFLHRLFVQSAGESLAWETPHGLIDFHAGKLWQRVHVKPAAAE